MKLVGHRSELDGIRGLAVAMVVLYHAYYWPKGGQLGVDIFFVLSGFLITTLLLEENAATRRISLGKFYARRALRLLPALAALLICYAAYTLIRLAADGTLTAHTLGRLGLAVSAGLFYFTNFLEAFRHSPDVSLGHLWSLSEEEQFYLLWPLVLIFLRNRPRLAVSVLSALVVATAVHRWQLGAAGASVGRLSYAPDTRSDGLLVGCIAAFVFLRLQPVLERRRRGLLLAATLALVVPFLMPGRLMGQVYYDHDLETLFVIAAAIALLAALVAKPRWLSLKPLVFLGTISYPLYLWHLPLIFAVHGASRSGHRNGFVLPTVAILVSLVAAVASTHYVEAPFLRLKRRFTPTRGGAAPRAEPAPAPAALATADS